MPWRIYNHIVSKIAFEKYDDKDHFLQTIDLENQKILTILDIQKHQVPNTIVAYAYTGDGQEIIFNSHLANKGEDIFIVNVDSGEMKKLFHLPYFDFTYPKITSDSRFLIWRSLATGEYKSQTIFSYDLKSGEQNIVCKPTAQEWCGDFKLLEP